MKKCKLINSNFSWILEVDGQSIFFQGSANAEYFTSHYRSLGYEIEWDNDAWKREQAAIERVLK